jgi:inosine/xanthosine triphosphatase
MVQTFDDRHPPVPSMIIAVGSLNPIKIGAVQSVSEKVWPAAEVVAIDAPSGVSAMPMSDAQCLLGARNRARQARQMASADMGFGLEGGVNLEPAGLMLMGWVAVLDVGGREGIGCTARLPLPEAIASRVLGGEELGPVMDELLGDHNVRQKGGAVGELTAGLVLRQETFAIAVAYALSPFVAPGFYPDYSE